VAGNRGDGEARADTLDVAERQKILRLLAKEILVGNDTITIRHSIPMPRSDPDDGTSSAPEPSATRIASGYLLRSGGLNPSLRCSRLRVDHLSIRVQYFRLEPLH
jgi:site-specific DNA recombinase